MREILFRGKRVDNGDWVEGWFCGGTCIHPFAKTVKSSQIIDKDLFWHEVIPETVGQYTGLTDKNGKKIFEGDYIVCSQSIESNHIDKYIEMGYVEMKHGAFGLHRKQGYYRPFKDWLEDYEYEVIGNIHDNPELLGGA
ncbi:MAG: hypothetical protein IJX24_04915 [Oscillospiraceae bacterium]|nr:hypothetical protein [Oscillospiraceae bacterium]